jgi:dihydroneopterin aldolase
MSANDAGTLRLLSAGEFPALREHDPVPMDVIFIEGFVGETVIGIHADELHATQPVRIDVAAGLPRSFACNTDRIADTIDYGKIRDALSSILRDHHHRLLEALAESIAQHVLATFKAHWVKVAVAKPRKFDDVDAVGVVIERRRPGVAAARAPFGERSVLARLGAGMFPAGDA